VRFLGEKIALTCSIAVKKMKSNINGGIVLNGARTASEGVSMVLLVRFLGVKIALTCSFAVRTMQSGINGMMVTIGAANGSLYLRHV
jgi:hypothetical protein